MGFRVTGRPRDLRCSPTTRSGSSAGEETRAGEAARWRRVWRAWPRLWRWPQEP